MEYAGDSTEKPVNEKQKTKKLLKVVVIGDSSVGKTCII